MFTSSEIKERKERKREGQGGGVRGKTKTKAREVKEIIIKKRGPFERGQWGGGGWGERGWGGGEGQTRGQKSRRNGGHFRGGGDN